MKIVGLFLVIGVLPVLFCSQKVYAQMVMAIGDDASCISVTAPAQVNKGSTFPATVIMQNTSNVNPWNLVGQVEDFRALGQTRMDRWSIAIDSSNHNVYVAVPYYNDPDTFIPTSDIYKQTGGVGDFVPMGQNAISWRIVAADSSNHNVYATTWYGDIYKQTGGVGDFVALGQTERGWSGIAVDSENHNVYAINNYGDIYKQTGGVGDFVALGQTERSWASIAIDSENHNVYATTWYDDIYKQTGGVGDFVPMGYPPRNWQGIAIDSTNKNIYTVESGYIYKQTGGVGDFVPLNETPVYWRGTIAVDSSNHNVYASEGYGDIYELDLSVFYSLGSQSPQDNTRWGLSRVALPSYTGPESPATFDITATAPATVGTYDFDWKMVRKDNEWFGDTCTKTIEVVSLPDLIVSNPSPSTASVGVSQTFTSTVTNIGVASTGSSFYNFFQVATAADGEGTITDLPYALMTALAPNGTDITNASYAFPSAGTYSVRACTDKSNRNDSGNIAELDEDNNCSDWSNVTVSLVSSANIKANGSDGPIDIAYNGTADITWTSSGATSCTVTPPNWTELNAPTGTHVLNLSDSVTYTISCLPTGPNSVDSVLVNVEPQPQNLNVIKTGQGTVTSVPAGISCGSGCQSQTTSFPPGTDVTLQVTVPSGRIFTGWSGDCSGRGACVIKMNNPKTIITNFAVKPSYLDF